MAGDIRYEVHKDGHHNLNYRYFDKNGTEIKAGDNIKYESGRIEKVYATDQGELGTDATNRSWLKSGRASSCEYGIYPLGYYDVNEVVVTDEEYEW